MQAVQIDAGQRLRHALTAAANGTGGWGYYAGKASRLEPTCWGLLALQEADSTPAIAHGAFLQARQQSAGWLSEGDRLPPNIAFNALVSFLWSLHPQLVAEDAQKRLLAALVASKGIRVENEERGTQDNTLQGWPWVDSTFSWVEPTSWGLVALKKARRAGRGSAAVDARVDEAERLLINRTCRSGGWNFGNATVMNQDLRAYVPTTALALLALQDRRADPAVTRSLDFLESHWNDEISAISLGLSIICLDVYNRPVSRLDARLREHAENAVAFGNVHGNAVALVALTKRGQNNVFRL